MSPFIKKQVLPRIAGLPVLAVGYWLGGAEGAIRSAGLVIAAGGAFVIYVLWRRGAGVRRGPPLYVVTVMALGIVAIGVALVGPLAPWLIANAQRH